MKTQDIILNIIKNNSPKLAVEKIMDRFQLPKTVKDLLSNHTPGTKVKIVANNSHHEFEIGDVVELKWVSEDDGSEYYSREYLAERVTDGRRWWIMLEDFEIIK